MPLRSKWIDLIYHVATGSRKVRNIFTPVGAFFYGLLIVAFAYMALGMDRLLGLGGALPVRLLRLLALPILSIALLLIGWSVLYFIKTKGTPVPFNPPPRLVAAGPYAHTRNPMLTGVFLLLFGLGVYFGSVSLVFIFTPIFILINYWEVKHIEEPELIRRLGPEYSNYREMTPMFFPDFGKIFRRNH